VNGSGVWHAEQAWLGHSAEDVLIEVEAGRIASVTENASPPAGAIRLEGWTIPGLANVHSHAFQRLLRGTAESGGGDFWDWRRRMYAVAKDLTPDAYLELAEHAFREMVATGITAVGEFHYLHAFGNAMGEVLIAAARQVGLRITLIDACYLRGGLDGRPLDEVQQTFSDGDADSWAARVDQLEDGDGARIAAAIHSVRAVDPRSMRKVAEWARRRNAPLHIHLAEQPAEVEECLAIEGCTPTQLLEREGILRPDLTAVHAIHVDGADISLLGASQVSICVCPTTERDLGDRVGPLRELAQAGSQLCLGSDSNAIIDLLEEARGLELDQRRATGRRGLHQPEELFRAATIGGMKALGWDAGEIASGKLADFITIGLEPRVLWRPITLEHLVFARSGRDVVNVVVGGKTLMAR
jgi:formiminoglutamate deiminase